MKSFLSSYKAEVGKTLRKKSIIVMLVIVLIVLGINILINELGIKNNASSVSPHSSFLPDEAKDELYDAIINVNNASIKELDAQISAGVSRIARSSLETQKAKMQEINAIVKYAKEKKLTNKDADLYTAGFAAGRQAAPLKIYNQMLGAVSSIIAMLGVILMYGIYVGEMNIGILKFELIRPIKRLTLFWSKITTVLSVVFTFTLIPAIISLLYSLRFTGGKNVVRLAALSTNKVIEVGVVGQVIYPILAIMFFAFGIIMLTNVVGSFGKNKLAALILPILYMLLLYPLFMFLLSIFNLNFFSIGSAFDFMSFIVATTAATTKNYNFIVSINMYLIYVTAFCVVSSWRFRVRDFA